MSLTRDDVIRWLEDLGADELGEFIDLLQQRLHLQPVGPGRATVTMGAPPTMGMPLAGEALEVVLQGFGARKLDVIRAVRDLLGLELLKARDLVESAPVVLRGALGRDEADALAAALTRAGARVEIR